MTSSTFTLLLALSLATAPTGAQEGPSHNEGEEAKKLELFVEGLGSDLYSERKESQEAMDAWAKNTSGEVPKLAQAAALKSKDPEIVARLKKLARRHFTAGQTPYFGFIISAAAKPQQRGLTIREIKEASPAARGGLMMDDHIIGVGEVKFADQPHDADLLEVFHAQTPHEPVRLSIIRNRRELRVKIRPGAKEPSEKDKKKQQAQFENWWREGLR